MCFWERFLWFSKRQNSETDCASHSHWTVKKTDTTKAIAAHFRTDTSVPATVSRFNRWPTLNPLPPYSLPLREQHQDLTWATQCLPLGSSRCPKHSSLRWASWLCPPPLAPAALAFARPKILGVQEREAAISKGYITHTQPQLSAVICSRHRMQPAEVWQRLGGGRFTADVPDAVQHRSFGRSAPTFQVPPGQPAGALSPEWSCQTSYNSVAF